jgi:hypothetical protein
MRREHDHTLNFWLASRLESHGLAQESGNNEKIADLKQLIQNIEQD